MKKLILVATCAASFSALALPVYEPFTEYTTLVTNNATNAIDLCSNGLVAPSGETWGGLNYAGKGAASGVETNGTDVCVTNWTASKFTSATLSTLLPANFPGMPGAGQSITTVAANPAQRISGATIVGNSAVLDFASDITRPVTGSKTLYVSYLLNVAQLGQLGTGNDGRYLAFLAQSNIYEPNTAYTYWSAMFNIFNTTTGPKYCGHGLLESNAASAYIAPCDSSAGKDFSTSPFNIVFTNGVAFVVGAYTFNASGADVNSMWVNPVTSGFGGPTPPATPVANQTMVFNMSDIAGLCLLNRPGNGQLGGVGTNYIANLMVGTTWSYVTGGPEFTTQPANAVVAIGANASITSAATAAAQSVSYQWQKITNSTTNNVTDGAGGAGGSATVSGSTNAILNLTGASPGDAGTYQVVATANGTSYVLTSATANVTISDPELLTQPASETVNYAGTAIFTATVQTGHPGLTYAWYDGSTILANGSRPGGSFAIGAQGSTAGGSLTATLTLTNVSYEDVGNYSLEATNSVGATTTSSAAALWVNDPYFASQPPSIVEIAQGNSAVLSVVAPGSSTSFQWSSMANGSLNNTGDYSGVGTSSLTISGAQPSDQGTYYVYVNGVTNTLQSSNVTVYVDTVPTAATVAPGAFTQIVGTHLAILGTATGGSGLVNFIWKRNGVTLTNGNQGDGSFVSGAGAGLIAGAASSPLILSNMTQNSAGTYTLVASNAAGTVTAPSSCVVTVTSGLLSLSTNNLIVTRVGDGAQPLSGATGNTLYLDQFTTSGGYVSTVMVPDSGPGAIIVAGGAIATGDEGAQEAYLTLSSNQQYLNFGGFRFNYPYTGGADVTVGGAVDVRGIYAMNASGIMALVYTNFGLYSGGHGFRDVYSTDGLTNFWTTGSASGGTVKYVNAGPAGASYTITTPGNGIPALGQTGANSGGVCLGLLNGNLVFSDNEADGDNLATSVWGLDQFTGAPMVTSTAASEILDGGMGHPDDFAFSPDWMTVYIADDDYSTSYSGSTFGGIQRYDYYGGTWNYAYNLSDTTGIGTNGMRGLTAYWPSNITSWGSGVQGAVLYATTSETTSNRIIEIIDNSGSASTSTLVATAGPNQFFRGIRFGPVPAPLTVSTPPSQTAVTGQTVDMSVAVGGVFSYYFPNATGTGYNLISVPPTTYQWYTNGVAITGATNTSYNLAAVQSSNAGTYTFVLTSGGIQITNSPAVLTVNAFTLGSDLAAWYKLGDGSGLAAADSSIYGNNGALQNFPNDNSEWVAALGGADALNFANVDTNNDNAVVIADAPQINFSNNLAFTLSAWVKSSSATQISGAAIINKGYGSGGEEYNFDVYTGAYRFFVRSAAGTVSQISGLVTPALNQWQHVAGTYDGVQGTMSFYVNGQLVGTAAAPGSLLYSTNTLNIGNRMSGATNNFNLPFLGEIQDVRIYDVCLGVTDIDAIYNHLVPVITGSPQFVTSPAPTFVSSGHLSMSLSGSANTPYRMWATTNAALSPVTTAWTLLGTGSFNASGLSTFIDPSATNDARYYSITQP